jgi:hypothetical protein
MIFYVQIINSADAVAFLLLYLLNFVWSLAIFFVDYVYRRELNLAISSSPVTKIMYRFYWRTAVNETKRNF